MILRSVPPSPFGRKVRITASVLGLDDKITIEPADTMNPDDSIRGQNPLGKIPALILDDGRVLYDSRVIIEYLDTIAGGGRVIPAEIDARFEALTTAMPFATEVTTPSAVTSTTEGSSVRLRCCGSSAAKAWPPLLM